MRGMMNTTTGAAVTVRFTRLTDDGHTVALRDEQWVITRAVHGAPTQATDGRFTFPVSPFTGQVMVPGRWHATARIVGYDGSSFAAACRAV